MADFPTAVPSLPQLPYYTQADILALFDRLLPSHYLAPLKDPGPGYEYLQAVAKVIERVSEAISHVGSGCYIGSSDGGTYSTVTVELYRDTDTFGEVTLLGRESAPQGTLVGTANGYYYQLLGNVTFGANDLGPIETQARAVTRGWLWNQPGPFYTADGEFVDGPINRLVKPVFPTDVPYPNFDPTIKVRQKYKTAYVRFARPSTFLLPERTILAGTLVQTPEGVKFATLQDVAFADLALLTDSVPVRPLEPITAPPAGAISEVVSALWGPDGSVADLTVEQTQSWARSDAYGGSSPMLDGVGNDRGLPRNFSGIRQVTLERAGLDVVVVLPGTVLSTNDGFRYQTTSTAFFPPLSTDGVVVSVYPLFLNEPANTSSPITQVVSVVYGSAATSTITVSASDAPVKETDADYRTRLTFLPKTLTPNAFRAAAEQILTATMFFAGKTWDMREIWDIRYQSAYDMPTSPTTLNQANTAVPCDPYPSAVFVYDYVPLNEALSNRYLAQTPDRGTVVFRLPVISNPASVYPGLVALLEQIKPAGVTVLYVQGDQ